MSVPAIALYTIPASPDYELNPRATSSSAPRPVAAPGGLSCLFSSPSPSAARHHHHHSTPSILGGAADELGSLCHDRPDELSSSFSYSPYSCSLKSRDSSPVSVLHGPVSCSSVSSRSPPGLKNPREWNWSDFRAGRDQLFDGFVRNALGSCLNYDVQSFRLPNGVERIDVDELTFDIEDSMGVANCEPYVGELLSGAQSRHKIFYEELIVKAFHEADKAHRGQMRASGDPYLQHCVETAVLLAKIGANSTVVAAGLLHDTLDDSFMDYDYIFRTFGAGVANLVEGVSKLSHLSKLARESNTASKTIEAHRLHTMFLAMADARAVLIKLADRLHNMMTLEALPLFKQQRFAKETLEIFTPLANRLGISSWKEQLENLCFKHLYPEQHKDLSSKLVKSFDEAMIASAIEKLEQALKEEGVSYHVLSGRHKSLYSIYFKMLKKKLTMDEIHDIHGLRVIVENKDDCYKTLNIVHHLWPKVIGRFKDYIIHPKLNGYQSLHTVVLSEDELPLEVQIRTKEMHLQAEFGFAAHWRYKEGDCEHSSFVLQMVEWARWVVTWQCETMNSDQPTSLGDSDSIRPPCPFPTHSADCPYFYTSQCNHNGPIFIIIIENQKMSVQEFPANAMVMDLLERAGQGGSRWSLDSFPLKEDLRPRLNHQPVSNLNQKLKMGDVVELTPAIPDKSLPVYRKEIQRMYNHALIASNLAVAGHGGWRN